jgi:preprotein translocase subunit YajC
MNRLLCIVVLLVSSALAFAADGPPAPGATGETVAPGAPGASGGSFGGLGPMILLPLVFAFMYFIVIRPQRREEKKRKELIEAVKRGDQVVTIGGLHGEVVAVGETTIDVRAGVDGHDTVLRFNKGAIASNVDQAKADAAKGK